jgi:hypothetical protein
MTAKDIGAKGLAAQLRTMMGWLCIVAAVAVIVSAGTGLRRVYGQAAQPSSSTPPAPQASSSAASPAGGEGAASKGTGEDDRKKQLADECADLLKMATALKAEVDKSTKDELSVSVVRKAGEIEQMVRKVRGETKLTASRN